MFNSKLIRGYGAWIGKEKKGQEEIRDA